MISQKLFKTIKEILCKWQFDITQNNEQFLDVKFCLEIVGIEFGCKISGDFVEILSEEWKGVG